MVLMVGRQRGLFVALILLPVTAAMHGCEDRISPEAPLASGPVPSGLPMFRGWSNQYFSINLPNGWSIAEVTDANETDPNACRQYRVSDAGGNRVFDVTAVVNGPFMLECWCAPMHEYRTWEKDGCKFAEWFLKFKGLPVARTLKVVGRKYGADIHASYRGRSRELLDRMIDSLRAR